MSGRQTVYVGDEVVLRKPHACGTNRWQILRTGADIKMACAGCGHLVWIERRRLEPRIRRFLTRGPRAVKEQAEAAPAPPAEPETPPER